MDVSEVAKHNKKGDVWIIIKDKVYDVSQFVNEHPGGEELIIDLAGILSLSLSLSLSLPQSILSCF